MNHIINNFKIFFTEFLAFFIVGFFTKVPVVALGILVLLVASSYSYYLSSKAQRLNTFSRYTPTILTTVGLLGTFIGLTMGLKEVKFDQGNLNVQSFSVLMENLKAVFIYALSGVFFSLVFMIANTRVLRKQEENQASAHQDTKNKAQSYNQRLIEIQENQHKSLIKLAKLQEQQNLSLLSLPQHQQLLAELNTTQQQQIEIQRNMQQDIAKLQFDQNPQQLARLISQGVIVGMTPLVEKITHVVADQGNEAIRQVLEELKTEILIPMNGALTETNQALSTTNSAVQSMIHALESSHQHNKDLIQAVSDASGKMKNASEKMQDLVSSINGTVQHMENIQVEQEQSLNKFNHDLQQNLARIQPAIASGLTQASETLKEAIGGASEKMQENIRISLHEAGEQLRQTVAHATDKMTGSVHDIIQKQSDSITSAFTQFDQAQTKFDQTLTKFSAAMNQHLERMATELKGIGDNAHTMINHASDNLKDTLGNIDQKLLNTSKELEKSLEIFRIQYQESLTEYLEQQTKDLDGFLDRQNKQLEVTIGQQRRGLEEVTVNLTEQFATMSQQQKEINQGHKQLLDFIAHTEASVLPKVEIIARELGQGEAKLSQNLDRSAKHLDDVAQALAQVGQDLPAEFAKAFADLNDAYKRAFTDLDHGLKDAVNNLSSVIGTIDSTAKGLVQAATLHDALTHA